MKRARARSKRPGLNVQPECPRTPPAQVTLTVANPAGSNALSLPIIVNGPPVAALTITPNPVGTNTPVTLNASGSTDPNGDPLKYSWDLNGDKRYGDATGAIQTRTFASAGTFRVGVRVTDPGSGIARPRVENGVIRLAAPQLMALVEGMDWTRVRAERRRRPTSVG